MPLRRAGETTRRLLDAVDLALAGDWQAAHLIVQELDQDMLASWIHAVVHRMEGDADNALYWYRRCGREQPQDLSTDAELRQVQAALGASPTVDH